MSVLREENTSREDYIQQYRGKTQRVELKLILKSVASCFKKVSLTSSWQGTANISLYASVHV